MGGKPAEPAEGRARGPHAAHGAHAAHTVHAAHTPHDAPGAARAATALWVTACALAVLRAGLTLVPTMHLWSLNLQRFLGPLGAWLPWALGAAALVPAAAKRATPALARVGDWIAGARGLVTFASMAIAAGLVWLLPDRVRFVGDFLLRQGTVEEGEKPSRIFPQALPLDVLLHYRLPLALTDWGLLDASAAARAIGAIEAALLAWLAFAFTRALGRRGAGAAATAAIVFFGGYLGMFTGYSKAFSELMLLTVVVAVAGLEALRSGRGLLPLGIAVALGVVLHRSALSLVPAMALVWGAWLRGDNAWKRPQAIAALAIPIATLGFMAPRIVADVLRWDAVHFNPAEVQAGGGPLRSALAGGRPLDLLNLLLLFSPLAVAAPLVAWFLRRVTAPDAGPRPDSAPTRATPDPALRGTPAAPRALPRSVRELLFLVVLALPLALAALFIHPAQGLFRDWDDFAATGVAISLVVAWLAGEALRLSPRHAWVAVGLTLGVAMPAVQWLSVHAGAERGIRRVTAFVKEPPLRTPAERAKTWDYLGIINYRREHWSDAAEAFAHAAETGPSARILLQWAMSATNTGDLPGARAIYLRLLGRYPDTTLGWLGLAVVESRLADATLEGPQRSAYVADSRRAAHELLKLEPGNPQATALLQYLERQHGAEPDSARR